MAKLSEHFTTAEFACHHCGKVVVEPELVRRLEVLRGILGRPITIVSGYRCAVHNRAVGGARGSKHVLGQAADLQTRTCTLAQARAAGFTGIGFCAGWVVHVDVRPGPRVEFPDC